MRFFNTEGPVNCKKHYCLPPFERLDIDEILNLIDREKYFVLHAPRQTGKTSCLLGLMKHVNDAGKYDCLYMNVEAAQGARENIYDGIQTILSELGSMAGDYLHDEYPSANSQDILKTDHAGKTQGILSQSDLLFNYRVCWLSIILCVFYRIRL